MFDEFLECTANKDELETVTIMCDDCVMQITLDELRKYILLIGRVNIEQVAREIAIALRVVSQ